METVTPSPVPSTSPVSPVSAPFPGDAFPNLNLSTLPDASSFVLKSALKSPHLLDSPSALFSAIGGPRRPRNMSQSSGTDREMSHDTTTTPTSQPNGTAAAPTSNGNGTSEPRPANKKRPSTDTIDYPRRRATIAVRLRPARPGCKSQWTN